MTLTDWIALIGAFAWLPIIIEWIVKYYRKTIISVIIDKSPEIGYTTFGSILNYRIALTAENGPVVVTKMAVVLKHESGETRNLIWDGMVQSYGSMTIDDKKMPLEKDQAALAVKINDNDVEERFFRFQDVGFNNKRKDIYRRTVERANIIQSRTPDFHDELLKSDEIHQLKEHLLHSMFWKSGTYSVEIDIKALSRIKVRGNKFSFILSNLDIERLNNNKSQFDNVFMNEVFAGKEGFVGKELYWNWQYPAVVIES